ncbi:hypothetical protein GLOTRDRAFT_73616 [Gloeophyllum trabeum ATCC 11539]|uniref:Pre-mRNA-splicing factor CWC24 n=1 Tax=Gloeophyllum trabeum (strain ATCC 11539 / FP-39264 / Madison 617) TaxID=670483 RepID=S7RR51_GLOTA|nr:uncharacterized protein GLOTRDRAFT_73616 [Gloeophyllum trabeum ATCC 11539]EPQ57080.1 hypothetical protein GLOTRDRAFT_73616 [Gloeophyllum trabeum ATCC 11539]
MASSSTDFKVPFIKKGKSRPATARKRSASPPASVLTISGPSSSLEKSSVVLPSRKSGASLLSAGTKRTVSQRNDDDAGGEREKDGPDVKWTAAGSHVNAALDILAGDEAEELLAKRRKQEKRERGDEDDDVPDDGLYRGQKAYKQHLKKSQDVPKAMRVGPQRNTSSTIRTVTITDYQPDVCKDYKETGYCGFGDTCKFLHDRGTYLAGWQLDKLAENPRKQVEDVSDDSDSDEDIPFACLICRKHYTDPVVTRCGHYFCSACAIKRYAKTPKCAACASPTAGIFNRADKVIDKLRKKEEAQKQEDAEDPSNETSVAIEGLGNDSGGDNDDTEDDDDE